MMSDKKEKEILKVIKKLAKSIVNNTLEPIIIQKIKDTENNVLGAISRLIRHCEEHGYNADVTLDGVKMFIDVTTKENNK